MIQPRLVLTSDTTTDMHMLCLPSTSFQKLPAERNASCSNHIVLFQVQIGPLFEFMLIAVFSKLF